MNGAVMQHIEAEFGKFRNKNTFWHATQDGTMDDFDRQYEAAVERVRSHLLGIRIPLVIDGKEVTTGEWVDSTSPTDTRIVVARFPKATKQHALAAIDAASRGEKAWADTPWDKRVELIEKTADLYTRDYYDLCAIMTLEAGKTRYEASIDVDEAIDFLRFYALTMRLMNGYDMQMGSPVPGEDCRSVLKPYGTFSVICPFNFPVAITTGMTAGALITGNTAILKPSTKGILSGYKCFQLLREAGIPASALQFVAGPGREVAVELTTNPGIDGLVFTGSKDVGFQVMQHMTEQDPGKPAICEMGGKNAIIVTAKADLDKAVEGVYRSAFGFQGQKCSACSRILVDNQVKDTFLQRLKARTEQTIVDYPWKKDAFMGPIIEEWKLKQYQEWVDKGHKDGRILTGGKVLDGDKQHGFYVQPTVVTDLPPDHAMFSTELFMPIVAAWGFDGLEEAVRLANSVEFGLTAGIFTEDDDEADYFFQNIQAGVTYLNRKMGGSTAAVVNGQAFGGWKHSGSTGVGAGGRYYLNQFLREQAQTRVRDVPVARHGKGPGGN